jgi:hypothetical protein
MFAEARSRISAGWNWAAGRKELAAPTTSRVAAARATGVLATGVTLVGFVLSYHGLLEWAIHYGRWGMPWAWFFPFLVDAGTAFGELRLYTAASDRNHPVPVRVFWWSVTLIFLAVSVAANVDHGGWRVPLDVKAGYALPSLVSALGLAAGLGLIKKAAARSVASDAAGSRAPAAKAVAEVAASANAAPLALTPATAPNGSTVTPGTVPRRPRQSHRASAAGVAPGEQARRYTSGSDPSVQAARQAIEAARARGDKVGGRRSVASQYGISEWQAGELLKQITRVNGTKVGP